MLVKIKDKLVKVLTVGELAAILGRKTDTLRKYEIRGILPQANFRTTKLHGKAGKRLYSQELAKKLAPIFKDVGQGVKFTDEQVRLIAVAFQEEKEQYQ
jgi:DNA-binding transcriptional MerR regulator